MGAMIGGGEDRFGADVGFLQEPRQVSFHLAQMSVGDHSLPGSSGHVYQTGIWRTDGTHTALNGTSAESSRKKKPYAAGVIKLS
jgi:hypothetical protein